MTDPQDDRDLQALWQSQPPDGSAIALDLIRQMAEGFEHRVARRNRREYVAAAVVVAVFGWQMFTSPSVTPSHRRRFEHRGGDRRGVHASPVGHCADAAV